MRKRYFLPLLAVMAVVTELTACAPGTEAAPETEAGRRTQVTMMYPVSLEHFEKLAEDTYPDIDLVIERNTPTTMNGDSERRLRNGHGKDLIVTTLPTGDVKEYVLDLSAEAYADHFQSTVMSGVKIEGKTCYLPLPGQYSGYILNRTLIERMGKDLPASTQDLSDLLEEGKRQGIGIGEDGSMFGLITVDPAAVGSYIFGTQIPDFLGTRAGIEWSAGLDNGTAVFSGVWDHSLDGLIECVDKGYLNAAAIAVTRGNATPVRERMLDGTLLFSYGNISLLTELNDLSPENEYVMIPFLSGSGNKPWTFSIPDGYLAVNKALADGTGKEDVLAACHKILELFSTQEGQDAWIEDTSSTTSYLTGYDGGNNEVPPGLDECVREGYVYNLQVPSNIIRYFGKNMISVLNGTATMQEALAAVDGYCLNGSEEEDYNQSVVGSIAEDMLYENYNTRFEETAIGNLVSDAAAEYTGADIAVVNGGSIRASLYEGDITGADLTAVSPYDNKIIVVEVDGRVIWEMLENGISRTHQDNGIPGGRFLQVSGVCYSYRPMDGGGPGEILSVTLADGTKLDPGARYTLAINDYMAGSSGYIDNNGDGYTMLNLYGGTVPKAPGVKLLKNTGAGYIVALKEYFYNHRDEQIHAKMEGRITVVDGKE